MGGFYYRDSVLSGEFSSKNDNLKEEGTAPQIAQISEIIIPTLPLRMDMMISPTVIREPPWTAPRLQ